MKQLIIIGAGGMGRTMYSNALECVGYGTEFIVKGFLNDFPSLDQFENYPPIIGTIENYQPQDEDVFVCSIGDKQRKQCIEKIQGRGGEFINLIHRQLVSILMQNWEKVILSVRIQLLVMMLK